MIPLTLTRKRPDGTVEEVEAQALWAGCDELRAQLHALTQEVSELHQELNEAQARAANEYDRAERTNARVAQLAAVLRAWVEHEEGYGPNPLGKTRVALADKLVGQASDDAPSNSTTERKSSNDSE